MAIFFFGPSSMACMVSIQCPGIKAVFISGIRVRSDIRCARAGMGTLGLGAGFFPVFLGSMGFGASAGIAQDPPSFLAPGIRPAEQNWFTRRSETPHFSAASRMDKYSFKLAPPFLSVPSAGMGQENLSPQRDGPLPRRTQ
jgi:hypothetical protein